MSGGIFFTGMELALAALDPARLQALLKDLMQRIVFTVESNTKQTTPVKTGNLRRSITGEVMSVSRGIVGSNVVYAPIVHRRNPYLDRGLAASSSTIDGLVAQVGTQWAVGS